MIQVVFLRVNYSPILFFAQGEYYDFGDVQMIILGVTESRANTNSNERADIAANEIRREFYQLYAPNPEFTILDLGNLLPSETPEESYEQLSNLLNELIPMIFKKLLLW